jgi:hypothetical protein
MLRWLTTVLARLTRRDTPGPPLRLGWNGRPLADAPEGLRWPDQPAPPTATSTLNGFVPPVDLVPAGAEPSPARSTVQATMSEELRTALNAIIGYSEMLQEEAQELGRPQFVADLEKIQRAGKRLLAVFTDFLERPRFEADEIRKVAADGVGPHDRVDSQSLHRADHPGG